MGKITRYKFKCIFYKILFNQKKVKKYKEKIQKELQKCKNSPQQKNVYSQFKIVKVGEGESKQAVVQDQYQKLRENNHIDIDNIDKFNINIVGKNNKIIGKNIRVMPNGKINIFCYGDNNEIIIGENVLVAKLLNITIGVVATNYVPVENAKIYIGEYTTFGTTSIITYNSNIKINIGKKCMFAFDVALFCTDSHPILDMKTNKIINYVRGIDIGDHVWVGAKSTILKNVFVADDCIVGWGSVCCKKYSTPHCVIGGNPAKIIKTGVTWDSNSKNGYVQNVIDGEK